MSNNYTLTLSCPDTIGIVSSVTAYISKQNGNIVNSSQHGELSTNTFFMRVEIAKDTLKVSLEEFKNGFVAIANHYKMDWQIHDTAKKKRMIILASKQSHCISDLLYRWRSHDIHCEIPCVISNHEEIRDYVEWHNIPYFHIPITNAKESFHKIDALIEEYHADVIVLARFMQIIPKELCKKYYGKMINIHHSFLPAFIGADPYKKAFSKGVKLVGATCHYVTDELDEGPIIEQDVIRINHSHTEQDIRRLGKDVEKSVLSRGVSYHLEDRVIIHGNKTVVF